jgi:hypothetical protein
VTADEQAAVVDEPAEEGDQKPEESGAR